MKSMFEDLLDKEKAIPLSETQVLDLVQGKANVIRNIDLNKYHSIDEMLEPYGACFLLYESRLHYGHWCCLIRYNNLLEFFDPYGGFPDSQLNYINPDFLRESGQDNQWLTRLLVDDSCQYDLSYNDHPFQHMKEGVATCGKWSALRMTLKELPLAEFKKLFLGKDSDDLVTLWDLVNS